jgi:hypothetical protein
MVRLPDEAPLPLNAAHGDGERWSYNEVVRIKALRVMAVGLFLLVGAALGFEYAATSKDGRHPMACLLAAALCLTLAWVASRQRV